MTDPRSTGRFYRMPWPTAAPGLTIEALDADDRLTDYERGLAKVMVRWRHLYPSGLPPAAFELQEQLDSGYIGFHGSSGPMLDMERVAEMFGVPVEETHEAVHELHASGLLVMDADGELHLVTPPGLLASLTNPDEAGQSG